MAREQLKNPIVFETSRPFIFHFRVNPDGSLGKPSEASLPMGGVTVLFEPTYNVFAFAACSPSDHFSAFTGRGIAQKRLMFFISNGGSKGAPLLKPINFDNLGYEIHNFRAGMKRWSGIISWNEDKLQKERVAEVCNTIARVIWDEAKAADVVQACRKVRKAGLVLAGSKPWMIDLKEVLEAFSKVEEMF